MDLNQLKTLAQKYRAHQHNFNPQGSPAHDFLMGLGEVILNGLLDPVVVLPGSGPIPPGLVPGSKGVFIDTLDYEKLRQQIRLLEGVKKENVLEIADKAAQIHTLEQEVAKLRKQVADLETGVPNDTLELQRLEIEAYRETLITIRDNTTIDGWQRATMAAEVLSRYPKSPPSAT